MKHPVVYDMIWRHKSSYESRILSISALLDKNSSASDIRIFVQLEEITLAGYEIRLYEIQ